MTVFGLFSSDFPVVTPAQRVNHALPPDVAHAQHGATPWCALDPREGSTVSRRGGSWKAVRALPPCDLAPVAAKGIAADHSARVGATSGAIIARPSTGEALDLLPSDTRVAPRVHRRR